MWGTSCLGSLKSLDVISRYLKNKSMDDLINDGFLCDAIENRFTKIAEDASKLSKEFKNNLSTIPWDGIASIRNRVCHDYGVVDFSVLYKTIKVNFPSFSIYPSCSKDSCGNNLCVVF